MRPTLRAREHLDLVLLAGLRDRPASGAELVGEVGRRSGGRFTLDPRTVHSALHRLRRNRMLAADGAGRYRLTDGGERSLRTREREWSAFVAAVDGVRAPAQEPASSSSSCS